MAQEFENAADELEALMNGSLTLDLVYPEDNDETVEDEGTDNEDTDSQDGLDEDDTLDTETNEMTDDDSQDTDEGVEDDSGDDAEENTQVEDSNLDVDEGSEEAGTADEDDSTDDSADEANDGDADDTGTEDTSDGDGSDTDAIDYKKQYEELLEGNKKLQGFYDEVTSEFIANGQKMKGFTDPKKIIQSQQMAAGFSEKMSAFKPYRPFMSTIKEQGWLDDPSKFDMAVNLMNKDPEAIKMLIKDSGIDVLDMDMENINYTGKSHIASTPEIVLDDMMHTAKNRGVSDEDIRSVLSGKWVDDGSVTELLSNPDDAQGFVNHMVKAEDGRSAFDDVQDRISEKLRTDYSGAFSTKTSLQQYKVAAGELEAELAENMRQQTLGTLKDTHAEKVAKIAEEKAKIEQARKEKEYKAKVAAEAKKASDARKKASSLSAPKKKAKAKPTFDPIDKSQTLEGDALMEYFNKNILGA